MKKQIISISLSIMVAIIANIIIVAIKNYIDIGSICTVTFLIMGYYFYKEQENTKIKIIFSIVALTLSCILITIYSDMDNLLLFLTAYVVAVGVVGVNLFRNKKENN
ncbi:MAG: hypothetical protein RR495_03375 [Anaerovoracaceae bacterium]